MTETLFFAVLIVTLVFMALQIIRARSLLQAALWLALVSVLTSILLYLLSARQVAVIELSVGAGLVTILFIFSINAAGDQQLERASVVPKILAAILVIAVVILLIYLGPLQEWWNSSGSEVIQPAEFTQMRHLDLLVQVVLIFAGVLGLVEILEETKAPLDNPMADEVAAKRNQDLRNLEQQSLNQFEQAGPEDTDGAPSGSFTAGLGQGLKARR